MDLNKITIKRLNWSYTSLRYNLFVFGIVVLYGLCFTLTGFYNTPFNSMADFLVLVMQWCCISIATYGLITLLSVNRWIFAILFPIFTFLCTMAAYFSYTAKVNLTPMIIDLVVANMKDVQTCGSLVEPKLVLFGVLSIVISIALVVYRWKKIRVENWVINVAFGVFCILFTTVFVVRFRNPVAERLPYSIFFSVKRYMQQRAVVAEHRDTFVVPPTNEVDSLTVVMVIGESLRADHLQLNGYPRATMPKLSEEPNVVSYPDIYTEAHLTHLSVPHILTRADSAHTERAFEEQSFITLFKQAGFETTWLANQESVDTYVYFMNECDSLKFVNSGKSLYIIDKWMDEDILPYYRQELAKPEAKQLLVVHTIGSHWYYPTHFDVETAPFQPNALSKIISSNTREEMINSYDNTIVETDRVVHEMIGGLRDRNAILLFLSDHGESLGEEGLYMHAQSRPEVHNPACFVWYSDIYAEKYPEKVAALRANKDKRYRTDFLFHSILDAASIETEYRDDSLSVF